MSLQDAIVWIDAMSGHFGFQLATSVLCGAIVGIERQLRGKAIGIRTAILICLATQVFIRLSISVSIEGTIADPTRVLGQVVTGVGFLGAGVILAKGGAITGVTSAAVVWMLAAIGSTIGLGRPIEALELALVVVGVLIVVRTLETAFKRLRGGYDEAEVGVGVEPEAGFEGESANSKASLKSD
jgi:putative Mg2+ transporter-C (MgtC) family protein